MEGFGLPPLEAMGGGCIPACRDSGGVRNYMHGQFHRLLFPLSEKVPNIVREVATCVQQGTLPNEAVAKAAFQTGLQDSIAKRMESIRRVQQVLGEAAIEGSMAKATR